MMSASTGRARAEYDTVRRQASAATTRPSPGISSPDGSARDR